MVIHLVFVQLVRLLAKTSLACLQSTALEKHVRLHAKLGMKWLTLTKVMVNRRYMSALLMATGMAAHSQLAR